MRKVVEQEGGCVVWGGAVSLSPADDILIRVERLLDLESEGQLVASVLSKKVAAGSTHVVIDIPVGPTAKVRTKEVAIHLGKLLTHVGQQFGLEVKIAISSGLQPVGRGIAPALEARDILAVLQGLPKAPQDLQERALNLAAEILDMSEVLPANAGHDKACEVLKSGAAWKKFQAICQAQGGLKEPPQAPYTYEYTGKTDGFVSIINLSRAARLAGAPTAPSAGLVLHWL